VSIGKVAALIALVVMTSAIAPAQEVRLEPDTTPTRPVHTYSIVARDPATGQLGVAVQSHWFNVGSVVPWAEAGVGAVATQSFVDPSYGKNGLDLMRGGTSAPDVLKMLLAKDPGRDVRQVAMIDARGRVAAQVAVAFFAAEREGRRGEDELHPATPATQRRRGEFDDPPGHVGCLCDRG
jgi:hypothetical protein